MGRGGSADGFRRLIGRIRKAVPGVIIRTSFITGFPGETAAQFAVLARFVEEMRFDRMGVFRYSDEEGTAAAALGPKVSRRVAEARRARLMVRRRSSPTCCAGERQAMPRRWMARCIFAAPGFPRVHLSVSASGRRSHTTSRARSLK